LWVLGGGTIFVYWRKCEIMYYLYVMQWSLKNGIVQYLFFSGPATPPKRAP
jgi:hypothetical protein